MRLLRAVSSADSTTQGDIRIVKAYWYQPTTIAHTLVIQDSTATTQVAGYCEVANQSQIFDFAPEGLLIKGHKVSTIASGTLYLYGP